MQAQELYEQLEELSFEKDLSEIDVKAIISGWEVVDLETVFYSSN